MCLNIFLAYDILGTARAFSRYYDNLIDIYTINDAWLRVYIIYGDIRRSSTYPSGLLSFWINLY